MHLVDENRLAIAVLAAGQSRRFGDADKLTVPFRGKMLGLHVCDTLRSVKASHRWVITSRADHPCDGGWRDAGFETVVNPEAALGMGTSVALAAQMAMAEQAEALMICLADMPLVPSSHYAALTKIVIQMGDDAIIASSDSQTNMPPACFGRASFAAIARSKGDSGARTMLKSAKAISCPQELLIDIDTPQILARLNS